MRGRIDFKYALGLELSDSGFDHTVLSEFRARLIAGNAEQLLLDAMLALFKERGWLKARGKQCTDSTHVPAKIRALNRVLCVSLLFATQRNFVQGILSDGGIEDYFNLPNPPLLARVLLEVLPVSASPVLDL